MLYLIKWEIKDICFSILLLVIVAAVIMLGRVKSNFQKTDVSQNRSYYISFFIIYFILVVSGIVSVIGQLQKIWYTYAYNHEIYNTVEGRIDHLKYERASNSDQIMGVNLR